MIKFVCARCGEKLIHGYSCGECGSDEAEEAISDNQQAPRRITGDQPMTQHIDTGGPAFPCVCTNDGYEEINGFNHDVIPSGTTCQYRGLTMRDYFAAKAMQGLLASSVKGSEEQFAEYSYKVADAMLRAREA